MTRGAATQWDSVHDARVAFIACLRAICDPGAPVELPRGAGLELDPRLDRAAAVLLALLDPGLGLAAAGSPRVERVAALVRDATGAGVAPVETADFVLIGDGGERGVARRARRGTALRPELGATVLFAGRWAPVVAVLDGPGLSQTRSCALSVPPGAVADLAAAAAEPPAGVDAFAFTDAAIIGLPRSLTVAGQAA